MKQRTLLLVIAALTWMVWAGDIRAQTRIWNNFSGSPDPFYHHSANWSGFIVPNSTATALFQSPFSYEVWWNGATEAFRPNVGRFHVDDGNVTLVNQDSFTQRQLTIAHQGSFSALSVSGDIGTLLTTRGVHLHALWGAELLDDARMTIDGSHNAGTNFTVGGSGMDISGFFRVQNGAIAQSNFGIIGRASNSAGHATITGSNSEWNASTLRVGFSGDGDLLVSQGAAVNSTSGFIGFNSSSSASAQVGSSSNWTSSSLYVGVSSVSASLSVHTGGVVSTQNGFIAFNPGSNGVATITGLGSHWENTSDLYIGGGTSSEGGNGTLIINTDGLVTVNGTTKIWSTGTVNLNGGQFDFGQISLSELGSINANSGVLNGTVNHSGFTTASTIPSFNNPAVDFSGVTLENSGTLHGNGTIDLATNNLAAGELFTGFGEMLRMTAAGNSNSGEINNFNGTIRSDQDITNQSGGFIAGRGQFVANGGWTNQGVMAFSGGPADILGDLVNDAGGQIVTSGGSTTTFFDDVVHNGAEIRTAAGSNTVFFGSQSGAGAFTGTGAVFYEGDLRPGNSPDVVSYEGDVNFGSGASSFFEIAGEAFGQYDRLSIQGDLNLDGLITVDLIDGYTLGLNEEFLVADVGGNLIGRYQGLSEGSLIGNFNGVDLFISYEGGDGNDVTLFSVPEPGSAIGIGLLVGMALYRRKTRI